MANIPVPRSRSAIIGDMLATFLSRTGLPSARVGSPHLSIIEAAAQSDLRSSQDIFNLLNSLDLDRATGQALDRIGQTENLPREGETSSSGLITVTDTRFTKIQTQLFQGAPAPIVGSPVIRVADASQFPASGNIYIGRGTGNYEGPLAYTSKTNNTNYWTLNLAGGNYTARYHNLGETVILAQGGDRLIPAGSIVQTPQGNAGTAVQFSTLFAATIPDGETSINSVTVTAQTPGLVGRVIAGSINSFVGAPFPGATATNPLPFTNGLATENDDTYRERIRAVRQSRSRGTPLAINTFITGITSLDENKQVLSTSLVKRKGYPTTLYIDDGTGYEERDIGIPIESIVDEALGGEQYFQLVYGRPVSKAYCLTNTASPFNLTPASVLTVKVGGQLSQHSFSADHFRSISNASAYEVAASINSNSNILFNARTVDSGSRVAIYSRGDTNEDIEVVAADPEYVDANNVLVFASGRTDTIRLYKNDRLLSKDGQLAVLTGRPQGGWATVSSGCSFSVIVDGVEVATTPANTYIINDVDFIDAGTEYTTVASTNSPDSWAKVLEYKVPGLTVTVNGGSLVLTSNKGRSSKAKVEVLACDLVASNFFAVGSATGKDLDYTFDRNLGQGRLEDSLILEPGDKLTAGSIATRAFLESEDLGTVSIAALNTSVSGQQGAELWFVVDGNAQIVKTGIGVSTPVTVDTSTAITTFARVRISPSTPSPAFTNVQAGDWALVTDLALNVANRGAFRVASVDAGGTWIEVERPASWATPDTAVSLLSGGITIVRTEAEVQRVFITNGVSYTASAFVDSLNSQLRGATASLYRTNRFRVRTNTFPIGGDIALVQANVEGRKLTLPIASALQNETTHLAALQAGRTEAGTPAFTVESVSSSASSTVATMSAIGSITSDRILVGLKDLNDSFGPRFGHRNYRSSIEVISGAVVTSRRPQMQEWLAGDRVYAASPYALTGNDELTVVLDGDTDSKRFVIPTFRRLTPGDATYGLTNDFLDADNSDASLAQAFGLTMNWQDFAVFMPARTKSHRISGVDTNKMILWRYKRLGGEGNRARLQYSYPLTASATTLVTVSSTNSRYTEINVRLPSGAARTGVTVTNNSKLGHRVTAGPTSGLYTYTYVFNLPIASATREVRLNYNTKTAGWAVGETVTGQTSLASGTISSVIGGAPGSASGTIVLTSVSGFFTAGETLDGSVSGVASAKATAAQYGVTKLTLTLPSGVTNHGFAIGDKLHMQYNSTGTSAGFITSAPTVSVLEVPSGTQINYIEGFTAIGATASVGTVSFDTVENKTTGSTVVVGDIMNVGVGTSLPANFEQSLKVATIADGNITGVSPIADTVSGTLLWAPINASTNLNWFPVSGASITAIAAAVNAQGDSSPVTAVALGTGSDTSGVIADASYEAAPNGLGGVDPWYYLSDGINWIRSNTSPTLVTDDYNFTFKEAVNSALATNSDWLNEDVRIVPITAKNIVDYLNTSGPGSLFANGEIVASSQAGKPQIASLTVGSNGSVNVQGGTANAVSAAIRGSTVNVGDVVLATVATISASDAQGLTAGHWMRASNSVTMPKVRVDSDTDLESISSAGVVVWGRTKLPYAVKTSGWTVGETVTGQTSGATGVIVAIEDGAPGPSAGWIQLTNITGVFQALEVLDGSVSGLGCAEVDGTALYQEGTKAWDWATTTPGPISVRTYQFEKQGDFVAIQFSSGSSPSFAGAVEGDWIHVSGGTASVRNKGLFRIVRIDYTNKTVWIENPNVLEEVATAVLAFLTYDSIVPGDELVIGTTAWGTNNLGTWRVASIDLSTYDPANGDNRWKFTLDVTQRTPQNVAGAGAQPLGTAANSVRVMEGTASHLYKRIYGIAVNPADSSLVDVKFDSWFGADKMSEAAGTILQSVDKLGFDVTPAIGIDGYRHTVGLIEEANRVGYGVDADPAAYPGVISAGANINIQGPLIRRVSVGLSLRIRTGISAADIQDQVRSAVAAAINIVGVGQPVALSDLIAAANSVNGVVSVTVVSPAFGPGSDLISIQPYEKPMVLNLDDDISISFVGE